VHLTLPSNGYAERWIGSTRRECLDHLLRLLSTYTTFYDEWRSHQGLDQRCPVPRSADRGDGPVQCREVLGGILHDYHREAA
jgi:hypothetical protein